MLRRIVIFLIRLKLKLKVREPFQFVNQKTNAVYYFTNDAVIKVWRGNVEKSGVSLNWLLDDECVIKKCFEKETDTNDLS
jgi:hypothetical protein